MKAAKEKMFWLKLVAVSLLFCAPTIALGLNVLTPQNRAELSAEYGQTDSWESAFGPAIHAEEYDQFPELASESPVAPKSVDLTKLSDDVLTARIVRGDAKGRPFGTPRNPRTPTLEEFNPRIHEVKAGDLSSSIAGRKHGLFPEQQQAIAKLSNEELLKFRLGDPMSATGGSGALSITGGHHRMAEIASRVASGKLPTDTIVRILLHD